MTSWVGQMPIKGSLLACGLRCLHVWCQLVKQKMNYTFIQTSFVMQTANFEVFTASCEYQFKYCNPQSVRESPD